MKSSYVLMTAALVLAMACGNKDNQFDASGSFETDEVIVSSELSGKLLSFGIREGMQYQKDSVVGTVDASQLVLQKQQVQESISALGERTSDVQPQIRLLEDQLKVQQSQLDNALFERKRVENLVKEDAATRKQLDDINASIDVMQGQMLVTKQQIAVQRSNTSSQNRGVLSETRPLSKRIAQIDDQLSRANIINPVKGTVLTKYAESGEFTSTGKALYKIADLDTMYLRAYITGDQLPLIKLSQKVRVYIDSGRKQYRELPGIISWIAAKAEFTPKTIQTKEERSNLVYAIKIRVPNDGFIKIGMYGEIMFQ